MRLRTSGRMRENEAEQGDVENNRRTLAALRVSRGMFLALNNLLDDGLIQAAFRQKVRSAAMHFFQQYFPGVVDKTHAAKADTEFLARRCGTEVPPALLKNRDGRARDPALDA